MQDHRDIVDVVPPLAAELLELVCKANISDSGARLPPLRSNIKDAGVSALTGSVPRKVAKRWQRVLQST